MSLSFLPDVIITGITDISAEQLQKRGIRLLMLDFDNTVVPYTTSIPTEAVDRWIKAMQASDIQLCFVSNTKQERLGIFCRKYGIDYITHAGKPSKKGYIQCLQKYGIAPVHAAMVGDQIFTDTLGGNRAGVFTILVPAIHNHNIWLKLRHVAEIPFIFLARKRRHL